MAASTEQLLQVTDIGPVVALSVRTFFDQAHNREVVHQLRAAGIVWADGLPATATHVVPALPLSGKTLVLTGTLPSLTRNAARTLIEAAGGKVTDSVSPKTDYVVAGTEAGSKLDRAQTLGITVIDEALLRPRLGDFDLVRTDVQ